MNFRHDTNIVNSIILVEHGRQKKLTEAFDELWNSEEWTLEQRRKLCEFKNKAFYR